MMVCNRPKGLCSKWHNPFFVTDNRKEIPMHIHDWSIKKKLLLSHFLMIGIPVFIVMVVILGILFSFLMATGSQKPTVLPGDDNASVSGYMLQLTVDSLTEQVAHTNPESLLQNDEVQDACESLQEMGANTVIYRGDTVYCQVGFSAKSIGRNHRNINCGQSCGFSC